MNKTVLITGSSRGIGAACARRFAIAGYNVMVHYHQNETAAQSVCENILANGGTASLFGADIADYKQAEALVHKTEEVFGGVDILVNNAGIAMMKMPICRCPYFSCLI